MELIEEINELMYLKETNSSELEERKERFLKYLISTKHLSDVKDKRDFFKKLIELYGEEKLASFECKLYEERPDSRDEDYMGDLDERDEEDDEFDYLGDLSERDEEDDEFDYLGDLSGRDEEDDGVDYLGDLSGRDEEDDEFNYLGDLSEPEEDKTDYLGDAGKKDEDKTFTIKDFVRGEEDEVLDLVLDERLKKVILASKIGVQEMELTQAEEKSKKYDELEKLKEKMEQKKDNSLDWE